MRAGQIAVTFSIQLHMAGQGFKIFTLSTGIWSENNVLMMPDSLGKDILMMARQIGSGSGVTAVLQQIATPSGQAFIAGFVVFGPLIGALSGRAGALLTKGSGSVIGGLSGGIARQAINGGPFIGFAHGVSVAFGQAGGGLTAAGIVAYRIGASALVGIGKAVSVTWRFVTGRMAEAAIAKQSLISTLSGIVGGFYEEVVKETIIQRVLLNRVFGGASSEFIVEFFDLNGGGAQRSAAQLNSNVVRSVAAAYESARGEEAKRDEASKDLGRVLFTKVETDHLDRMVEQVAQSDIAGAQKSLETVLKTTGSLANTASFGNAKIDALVSALSLAQATQANNFEIAETLIDITGGVPAPSKYSSIAMMGGKVLDNMAVLLKNNSFVDIGDNLNGLAAVAALDLAMKNSASTVTDGAGNKVEISELLGRTGFDRRTAKSVIDFLNSISSGGDEIASPAKKPRDRNDGGREAAFGSVITNLMTSVSRLNRAGAARSDNRLFVNTIVWAMIEQAVSENDTIRTATKELITNISKPAGAVLSAYSAMTPEGRQNFREALLARSESISLAEGAKSEYGFLMIGAQLKADAAAVIARTAKQDEAISKSEIASLPLAALGVARN